MLIYPPQPSTTTTINRHENKKNKDQPTNNHKNNRKIKAIGNITRIPERGLLRDTDPLSNMSY